MCEKCAHSLVIQGETVNRIRNGRCLLHVSHPKFRSRVINDNIIIIAGNTNHLTGNGHGMASDVLYLSIC